MTYTIKINQTESDLAKKLIWYLQSLTQTKEYDFLQIIEDLDSSMPNEQKELDIRYEHFLLHKDEYSDWADVKHKFDRN